MAHGESIPQHPVDISPKGEKSGQDTSREAETEQMASAVAYPTTLERNRLAGMDLLDAQALRDAVTASVGAVLVKDMMGDQSTGFGTRRTKFDRKFRRAYGLRYLS
eukprot:1701333-Amphidinium_carterae.1